MKLFRATRSRFPVLTSVIAACHTAFSGVPGDDAEKLTLNAEAFRGQLRSVVSPKDYEAVMRRYPQLPATQDDQLLMVYALDEAASARPPGKVREALVEDLTRFLKGTSEVVRSAVLNRLAEKYEEPDFGDLARERLLADYRSMPHSKAGLIAAGLAVFDKVGPDFRVLSEGEIRTPGSGMYYGTGQWAAVLILARHGDKGCVDKLMQAVKKEEDIVVRTTVLVNDLRLVRRPEVVEFLAAMALSSERLPSVKPTAPGTLAADRAIRALATILESTPALRDPSAPTENERQAFRAWLSKSSNLKIKPVPAK